MKTYLRLSLLLTSVIINLMGCGQKGDLVRPLPSEKSPISETESDYQPPPSEPNNNSHDPQTNRK